MCMSWSVDHVTSAFHRPGLALAGHWKSVGYAGLSCAFLNSQVSPSPAACAPSRTSRFLCRLSMICNQSKMHIWVFGY